MRAYQQAGLRLRAAQDARGAAAAEESQRAVEGELDDGGDGLGCGGWKDEVNFDVDGDCRVCGVVDVAHEALGYGGDSILGAGGGGDDLPVDGGNIGGNAANDIAVEELDQLGTALGGPILCGFDGLAVVEYQRVGEIGPGIGLGLVPVDGVGTLAVLSDSGTQRGDAEEVHHVLMVVWASGWASRRWAGRELQLVMAERAGARGIGRGSV